MLETIGYALNPGTRRRRARRAKGRRARRRNSWRGAPRRHARAARKGWRSRRHRRSNPRRRRTVSRSRGRRRRRRNPDPFTLGAINPRRRRRSRARRSYNPRRRRGSSRRRRNPGNGALSLGGVKMGFPSIIPGLHLPLPGIVGKIVNGAIQGVAAGGIVFAGYFGSGYLVNLVVDRNAAAMARSQGDKFKGYWARPLMFAGTAGVLGGLAATVAPKGKGVLWGLLAAAGPAVRAFGGIVFALLGEDAVQDQGIKGDIAAAAVGLSDYIQTGELYQAGLGDDDNGMEDYIQTDGDGADDGTIEMGELYEAGMGAEDEEVIGI